MHLLKGVVLPIALQKNVRAGAQMQRRAVQTDLDPSVACGMSKCT